jgi:predicted transcriptional regulator
LEFKTDLKNNAIQKNLVVLMNAGLIQRDSVTLSDFKRLCQQREDEHFSLPMDIPSEKGYLYLYKTKPTEDLKALFDSKLKKIQANISIFDKVQWS